MKRKVKNSVYVVTIILFNVVFLSACVATIDYGKDTVYYNDGTMLELGEYPRREVNEDMAKTLEEMYVAGTLTKSGEWYEYEENRYARHEVVNDYVNEDTTDYYFTLFTQYVPGTVHWFAVEPIKWRLMNKQGVYAVLMTDELIASRDFSDGEEYKDWLWENSDLRNWLNNDFYQTAFTKEERKLIQKSESPCYYISNPGRIKYERESVNDYIRIPEWREVLLPEQFADDAARRANVTDYARACGGLCVTENAIRILGVDYEEYKQYIGSGIYWLIDTEYNSDNVYIVYEYGNILSYKRVVKNRTVRPTIVCRYAEIKKQLEKE